MSETLGDRLRKARKRVGLSPRDLARESGVSYSLITKIEQGERQDTRWETLHRLARVLGTTTSALITGGSADRVGIPAAEPSGAWHEVGRALADTGSDVAEAPTVRGVRAAVDAVTREYRGGNFSGVATLLPQLIRDAHALADLAPEGAALRMRALTMAGRLLTQTRQYDLADQALTRALRQAPDARTAAAAVDLRCWLLLRRGHVDEVRELAVQWADDLEPRMSRATPTDLAMWGWLLLRAAAAAGRDNRPEEAAEALRLAHAAAVAVGRPHQLLDLGFIHTWSVGAVRMQRAEYAMVRDRPDEVLRLSAGVGVEQMSATNGSRNRHLLDVAHAQVRTRRYAKAVETLSAVHRDAPQWLPHQRYAQDIVRLLTERRRTLTPDMRRLAEAVRLPL
ncbi:helix-turn-helix domain-containing protein [Streptomyces marincola]|uniref:helix-turn-helix domain-containing protein n=1 Tax=Streptomyces marincola TaxID=2878388 RepID=UPI001CF4A773|nr:helix-turn-helix transcriptional regulator [Streptomyces marincola]UCM87540.1 helix-turn-helix domain-containing protein [Streptomyces marincola]